MQNNEVVKAETEEVQEKEVENISRDDIIELLEEVVIPQVESTITDGSTMVNVLKFVDGDTDRLDIELSTSNIELYAADLVKPLLLEDVLVILNSIFVEHHLNPALEDMHEFIDGELHTIMCVLYLTRYLDMHRDIILKYIENWDGVKDMINLTHLKNMEPEDESSQS